MESNIREEWRPVPEFEGAYEVSNLGQVRSLDRWAEYVIRGNTCKIKDPW